MLRGRPTDHDDFLRCEEKPKSEFQHPEVLKLLNWPIRL